MDKLTVNALGEDAMDELFLKQVRKDLNVHKLPKRHRKAANCALKWGRRDNMPRERSSSRRPSSVSLKRFLVCRRSSHCMFSSSFLMAWLIAG